MIEENELTLEIVRPIESDAHTIMEWRNDPLTLHNSFHQSPKVWETFWNEFQKEYFVTPEIPSLFVCHNKRRVAFLRFGDVESIINPHRKACYISINVAPEERGKGYGKATLNVIKSWLLGIGIDDLYAEVKEDNIHSQKLFLSVGFKEIAKAVRYIDDLQKEVPIRSYHFMLTRHDENLDKVFVVAEAGSNWRMGSHHRDLAMARVLIDVAVDAGADAVKFQTFRPETVYVHNAGQSKYLAEAGILEDIHSIFEDLSMPYEMVHELAAYCQERNIEFMSTPFSEDDFHAVDAFVRRHKIASYEITHLRLIELAAKSGKALILSTGAATEQEIAWAIETFKANGGEDITLLQCTACYPTQSNDMNLRVIPWLKHRFRCKVGLSDHSREPLTAPISAVALGASVIEKHFTLSNNLPGPDHSFAVTPCELIAMVKEIRNAEKMRGSGIKTVLKNEQELRSFAQRGIQAIHDIRPGDLFHEGKNIAILRPGNQKSGIHPKYIEEIEGKKAKQAIKAGTGISFSDWE